MFSKPIELYYTHTLPDIALLDSLNLRSIYAVQDIGRCTIELHFVCASKDLSATVADFHIHGNKIHPGRCQMNKLIEGVDKTKAGDNKITVYS